jgi:predicted nucleic acid-binding Zn ribbon protein
VPDDLDLPADDDSIDREVSAPSGIDAAKEALARARAASSASGRAAGTGGPSRSRSGARRTTGSDRRSGPGPDGRDPMLLGSSVEKLLRERGWEQPTAAGGLTGRWAEIVGIDVAEHVQVETFEPAPDGRGLVLVLRADSTAWATTLQYMLPTLRTRIDAELGAGAVRDITVLGPAAPSWKHGKLRVQGRGPRDTYG